MFLECTHSPMPPNTRPMPKNVSECHQREYPRKIGDDIPRETALPSAKYSPRTVNMNASEFVMGTIKLISIMC